MKDGSWVGTRGDSVRYHIHRPVYSDSPVLTHWICADCGEAGSAKIHECVDSIDRYCAVASCTVLREFGDLCGYHHAKRKAEKGISADSQTCAAMGCNERRSAWCATHWRAATGKESRGALCAISKCDEPPTSEIFLPGDFPLAVCAAHRESIAEASIASMRIKGARNGTSPE